MRAARILGLSKMAVWTTIAVLVAASLAMVTVGCTGNEETTSAMAPTTSQAPSTTATSEATTTTAPPSASPPDTGTTTTAASTTTTSVSGPTTTEALSSAETRLPDGTIKGMGLIDKVWVKDGARYLSIDYAEMLTGEEARQAAIEAGVIQPGEYLDNDYFIRNVNTKKREFTIAPDVVITTATRQGGPDEPATWEQFLSFWGPNPADGATYLKDMPWWIIRDGTEVIGIAEQYLP